MKRSFLRSFSLILLPAAVFFALQGCGHGDRHPDVSGVEVKEVVIERFDTAFFSLDSNRIQPELYRLAERYPWFIQDFVANILGAGPLSDTNRLAPLAARQFLVSYLPVKDSIEERYRKLDWLEKDLHRGFQFVKYYFPKYHLPQKVVAFIGPFDGPAIAVTPYALAIGLQLFAGKDFSFYLSDKGMDLYPPYLSRRFEPAYITTGCMKAIATDILPDNSENKSLIEQMIAKGKYAWLLDQFLPETADSIRTGYTGQQLDWCNKNEGLVWNYFLQNTDLYTVDPDIIKNYIGESPKTLGMPDASPGNIGSWIGRQIVQKYAASHPELGPEQILHTPERKIFDEAKYKPR